MLLPKAAPLWDIKPNVRSGDVPQPRSLAPAAPGIQNLLLCNGEQTPTELFRKQHTCKIKLMDGRGNPEHPLHLLPSRTPAKLLLPSTMSLHLPAMSVLAMVPSHTCQGFMLLTPTLKPTMKRVGAQQMSEKAACPGTCRDLDLYQCPDTSVTKSS